MSEQVTQREVRVGQRYWCRDASYGAPFSRIVMVTEVCPALVYGNWLDTDSGSFGSGEVLKSNMVLDREVTIRELHNARRKARRVFQNWMGDFYAKSAA